MPRHELAPKERKRIAGARRQGGVGGMPFGIGGVVFGALRATIREADDVATEHGAPPSVYSLSRKGKERRGRQNNGPPVLNVATGFVLPRMSGAGDGMFPGRLVGGVVKAFKQKRADGDSGDLQRGRGHKPRLVSGPVVKKKKWWE